MFLFIIYFAAKMQNYLFQKPGSVNYYFRKMNDFII